MHAHAAWLDPDAHKVQRPRVMELHETNPSSSIRAYRVRPLAEARKGKTHTKKIIRRESRHGQSSRKALQGLRREARTPLRRKGE